MPRSRPYKSGLRERLKDPEHAAAYLNAVARESRDVRMLALRDVAEVHKISKIAIAAGVNRETLYRTLSARGNPTQATLDSIWEAVGVEVFFRARVKPKSRGPKKRSIAVTPSEKTGTLSNLNMVAFGRLGLLGPAASALHKYESSVTSRLTERAVNADFGGITQEAINPHLFVPQMRVNDETRMFANQSFNP